MRNMLKMLAVLLLAIPAVVSAVPTQTAVGRITLMAGGWVISASKVELDVAQINPGQCAYLGGYMVSADDPGRDLFHSMLLSAYMANRRVQLTLDGCIYNHNRIIEVKILP